MNQKHFWGIQFWHLFQPVIMLCIAMLDEYLKLKKQVLSANANLFIIYILLIFQCILWKHPFCFWVSRLPMRRLASRRPRSLRPSLPISSKGETVKHVEHPIFWAQRKKGLKGAERGWKGLKRSFSGKIIETVAGFCFESRNTGKQTLTWDGSSAWRAHPFPTIVDSTLNNNASKYSPASDLAWA